ncbi:MAG TPA: branched-chain amino acid ABC transporter permease [Stellaceae bacterium]|nr:branched-chain amino acid ABC transporter permease [Stellaceae bacterium]
MTTPQQETVPFGAAAASGARRPTWPQTRHWVLAAALAVAIAAPFFFHGFVIFQLTEVMIYGLAILGLNLLTGFNGQFSVGHGAFYGLGAYVTAIMMQRWGIAYYWTLPAAGGVCFVVGVLVGLPALRLQGLYLALVTFAAAVALPQLLKFHGFEGWTGGVQGIVVDQPDVPGFLPISADQWLYFFTLGVMLLMFAGASNLIRSRTGRAIMAIRDHPIAAAAMGINAPVYKTLTFGVSALYTGVAGALGALAVQFVAPDSFTLFLSISFLVGLIIGGMGSLPGCLFGGLFVLYVPNIAESVSRGLAGAVYGVIMLLVIFAMPSGAAGFVRHAAGYLSRWRNPPPEPAGQNLAAPQNAYIGQQQAAGFAVRQPPGIVEEQALRITAQEALTTAKQERSRKPK